MTGEVMTVDGAAPDVPPADCCRQFSIAVTLGSAAEA
jgi:hypothetical protein